MADCISFSGAILAGGQSLRMGRDKAFLECDGNTLISRQAALLQTAGASEILICGRENVDYGVPAARVFHDEVHDAGPLAGLASAFAAARQPWVLVVAVDLPRLNQGFLQRLLSAGEGRTGTVPRSARGFEPLAALYPSSLAGPAAKALQRGEFALQAFVRQAEAIGAIQVLPLAPEDEALLVNWNTPEDFQPAG